MQGLQGMQKLHPENVGKLIYSKVKEWDSKVGKIIVNKDFDEWIKLNAPFVIAPFYPEPITPLNQSDITFSVEYNTQTKVINPHRFAIGCFYPEITEDAFKSFLYKYAQKGKEWLEAINQTISKELIICYGIGVDYFNKEWRFYVQTSNPEKMVIALTVDFQGKTKEEKTYHYVKTKDTTIAIGQKGKRKQINVGNAKEQYLVLSFVETFVPQLADKLENVISLGFSLDTVSLHQIDKTKNHNRLVFYFEPLITI